MSEEVGESPWKLTLKYNVFKGATTFLLLHFSFALPALFVQINTAISLQKCFQGEDDIVMLTGFIIIVLLSALELEACRTQYLYSVAFSTAFGKWTNFVSCIHAVLLQQKWQPIFEDVTLSSLLVSFSC